MLREIEGESSITKAAEKSGIPYRTAWKHLHEIEIRLETPILETHRGGFKGGGGAGLTKFGEQILHEYERLEAYLKEVLEDEEYWEAIGLKLSARNRLNGIVKEVEKGEVTASVKIEINMPTIITAVITKEAANDLDIKPGDEAEAVIKATEVMVAKK